MPYIQSNTYMKGTEVGRKASLSVSPAEPPPCPALPRDPRAPRNGLSIAPSSSSPHPLTLDRAGQPQEPLLCNDSRRRGAPGAPSPGNSPQEILGGPLEGTGRHGGGCSPPGMLFSACLSPPGALNGIPAASRAAQGGCGRSLPARPSPAPRPRPSFRSAPLARGPRGDTAPGSAAPRDKEPPGGSAEGESERRPGRPRRQGRAQPPPAHPHTCAGLCRAGPGEPERGAVKAARRPPPALRPIPSPGLWVRKDLRRLRALRHGPRAPRAPAPFIARAGDDVSAAERPCTVSGKSRRISERIGKEMRGKPRPPELRQ